MSERRFNEAEVAEIFERAAEAQHTGQRQIPSGEGMTLAQIQEIGAEVGFSTEQLAQAAQAIELRGRPTSRHFLGFPIGVGVTVDLNRKLSDEEWARVVVDLRETFDARGRLRDEGAFRQWSNGNLQVFLEPTPTAQQLRLRTLKGDARGLIVGAIGMLGFSAVAAMAAAAQGVNDFGTAGALAALSLMGAGLFGYGAVRLPRWARLRRRQMEDVAARVINITTSEPPPDRRISG